MSAIYEVGYLVTGTLAASNTSEICTVDDNILVQPIVQSGEYNITSNIEVQVSAADQVSLNYLNVTGDNPCDNFIVPSNIGKFQQIAITGFEPKPAAEAGLQFVVFTVSVLISVAAFSIIGPAGLVIVPIPMATNGSSSESSQIILNDQQSIILKGVNVSYIDKNANFIYAPNSTNSGSNDDDGPLPEWAIITIPVVGGTLLLSGVSYIVYRFRSGQPLLGNFI